MIESDKVYMKHIHVGGALHASEIILGCMRINQLSIKELDALVHEAIDLGIDTFDHADIYGKGSCETLFSHILPSIRSRIKIQSKCGICDGYYDLSKEHILTSVDGILQRLNTDYLDTLILHRPDTLMDPEEIAEAFDRLHQNKVLHFGVSNFNSMQIELLRKYIRQPIILNQMQFGIAHTPIIDSGIQTNTKFDGAFDRDGNMLEYARYHDITLQAWSPFQFGFFEGVFLNHKNFEPLNQLLQKLGHKYQVDESAISIAWILNHPAHMQVVVGTTQTKRLKDLCKASRVQLTKQEWYAIYQAAGRCLP
jgi:predicted oxidoreductase